MPGGGEPAFCFFQSRGRYFDLADNTAAVMMFSAENPLWSDCEAMFVGAAQMQQFQRRTEWTPAVAVQHSNYLPVNYSQSLHTRARAHKKK